MPHCIVEHASVLSGAELNRLVFLGALDSGLFEPDGSDIKVRSMAYEQYSVGGESKAFVHVSLKILSGRDALEKKILSQCVLSRLGEMSLVDVHASVDVIDMDRDSYLKCWFNPSEK